MVRPGGQDAGRTILHHSAPAWFEIALHAEQAAQNAAPLPRQRYLPRWLRHPAASVAVGARHAGHAYLPLQLSGTSSMVRDAPDNRQGVGDERAPLERTSDSPDPESWRSSREGRLQALTGERAGWVLSPESD